VGAGTGGRAAGAATGGSATGGASTGGGSATGGSATGGSATGGSGGASTGGSSTGGADGSGAGPAFVCDPEDPLLSECDACVQAFCCDELQACADDPLCGGEDGEIYCLIECVDLAYSELGVITPDDVLACAAACAYASNGIVAAPTDALVACIRAPVGPDESPPGQCSPECLNTGY
jgi:hypothetical protein